MPQYKFEAIDGTGKEIKDIIEAQSEDEAQATIRQMGYHVTRIALHKDRKVAQAQKKKDGKTFSFGRVPNKQLTTFTRQLSILQDAGLPILRSLHILANQAKNGALRNNLIDVCAEIENGSSLSESMSKCPRAFNRLYVNMVKAGEAGGALEVILQRLAEFLERSQRLMGKIKSALIYPIFVILAAVGILIFLMIFVMPTFEQMFADMNSELPWATLLLMEGMGFAKRNFLLFPVIPLTIYIMLRIATSFEYGRFGWHLFLLKIPIFGLLFEKTTVARTTRTLGTLVTSGVPILEALHITKETSNNGVFERIYQRVLEAIRDGDTIANPMKVNARPPFHFGALAFATFFIPFAGALIYLLKFNTKILDDMVVNMVDVGEETGELDMMLYKVADTYDDQVETMTAGLMSMLEPVLILGLGGMVGFIVVALFMPMIKMITEMSSA